MNNTPPPFGRCFRRAPSASPEMADGFARTVAHNAALDMYERFVSDGATGQAAARLVAAVFAKAASTAAYSGGLDEVHRDANDVSNAAGQAASGRVARDIWHNLCL